MMDLVTLITVCSLGVEPKLMHALAWHQSGTEPWSFTVPGERQPRVYRKLRDAVREAHALPADGPIRVGLAGLTTEARAVTETTFLPCPNIAAAARRITQLAVRCETSQHPNADPTFCAVAAYRGSWDRPDTAFADAVRASVTKDDAPNFDMPRETGLEARDALLDAPPAPPTPSPSRPEAVPDDRQRAWSSALFPASESRLTGLPPLLPRTVQLQRNRGRSGNQTSNRRSRP
jgi:hypothetical protein